MNKTKVSSASQYMRQEAVVDGIPASAGLKVLHRFSGLYPDDPDELEAYHAWVGWCLARDHAVLFDLPAGTDSDFFPATMLDDFGNDVSAFNTMDFKRLHPFTVDKERYAVAKIFERLEDLAQTHSILSNEEGRLNTWKRFKQLVEREFISRAFMFKRLMETGRVSRREGLRNIEKCNERIRQAKRIWARLAYEP